MTSTELVAQSTAYSRAPLTERQQYVALLSTAGSLLPQPLREGPQGGNPGKTFLLCETGDMLGIHPIAAMTGVHIIEGRPAISANLMNGLVRKAGHKLRVTVTGKPEDESLTATAVLIRDDDPDFPFTVTWTMADAKRAGLWPGKSGSNWQKYPRPMMKSRVISEVVREGAADVLMGGNVYTPEELGAQVDEQGEPITFEQVPSQGGTERHEAPIVDEQTQQDETDFDWGKAVENIGSYVESATLWQKARALGKLSKEIEVEGEVRALGDYIAEVGTAFKKAEAAQPSEEGEPQELPDEEPAVLAEIVDDDQEGSRSDG